MYAASLLKYFAEFLHSEIVGKKNKKKQKPTMKKEKKKKEQKIINK